MVWISDPLPEDSTLEIPVRRLKDEGTLGKTIKLRANYFRVNFTEKDITIYHFDVKITDANDIQEDKLCEELESNLALSASNASVPPEPSNGKKKKKKKHQKAKRSSADAETQKISEASSTAAESPPAASQKWVPKALKRKIFQAYIAKFPKIFEGQIMAYDGGISAYSTTLPAALEANCAPKEFSFKDPERNRTKKYKLEWKLVEHAKLKKLRNHLPKLQHMPEKCQTIFQGLEVMFNYERTLRFTTASFNRFLSHDAQLFGPNFEIGRGKEGVRGFFMSLRPCQGWKDEGALLLNIDVSHAVFYRSQHVLDYLRSLPSGSSLFGDRTKPLSQRAIEFIHEKLIDKKIKVELTKTKQPYKRKYQVAFVSHEDPFTYKFETEKGNPASRRSVAEHFRILHGIELKYHKLNCFIMSNRAYVPIEVCQIAAKQLAKGKLSRDESKDFIKSTAVRPQDRQERIKTIFRENKFDEDPGLNCLKVSIDSDLVSVDGRVLPAPVVKISKTQTVEVENGKWTVRYEKFNLPSKLINWGILNFSTGDDAEKTTACLKDRLITVAKMRGMEPEPPLFEENFAGRSDGQNARFLKSLKKCHKDLQLIVFLKDDGDDTVYDLMKSLCEGELNVATQCVLVRTLDNASNLLMTNILIKINAKLGRVSHVSLYEEENYPMYKELFCGPVMVMGADVNHPSAGDKTNPSMVAVVASVDQHASRYVHEVRHQTARLDFIEDMQEITQNLLEQFRAVSECLPKRIFMYRDGVSDTQFNAVVARELRAMREACTAIDKDYKPPMTFICVQKRHHTRLFCANKADADRSGNVPPGTVVDTVIATHSNRNFFLCSHAGIQGTSKPSHYTVLWDDSDLTMDQLQLLTYALCHNYARCFRAVSMPSPVFYADRAAYRAKTRLEGAILQDPEKWVRALLASTDGKYPEELLSAAIRVDQRMEASKKMSFV